MIELYLITGKNCQKCGPYAKMLTGLGVAFQEKLIEENRRIAGAYRIQCLPSLVILENGKYKCTIPGAVMDRLKLVVALRNGGVKV